MYVIMADCSELQQVMFDIAMHHASEEGIDTVDKVVSEMKTTLPLTNRENLIASIIAATETGTRILTDIQKQMEKIKREARNDTELSDLIDELNKAIEADTLLPDDASPKEEPTEPIARLRAVRDKLQKQLKTTSPNKAIALEKKIKALEEKIAKRAQAEKKGKPHGPDIESVEELKNRHAKLTNQLKEIRQEDAAEQKIRDTIMAMDQALEADAQLPASKKGDPATNPVLQMLRQVKEEYQERLKQTSPAKIKALEKQIAELSKAIRVGGHVVKKGKAHGPDAQSVEALKDQRAEMKQRLNQMRQDDRNRRSLLKQIKELDTLYKRGGVPEPGKPIKTTSGAVRQLQAIKKRLKKLIANSDPVKAEKLNAEIEQLEKRLEAGDFVLPRKKPPRSRESREIEKLMARRDRLKLQVDQHIKALEPKHWLRKWLFQPMNGARAVMASTDLSAVGRQGWFLAASHPVVAAQSIVPMIKSLRNDENADAVMTEIMERDNVDLYHVSGLEFTEVDGSATAQEETFMTVLTAGEDADAEGVKRGAEVVLRPFRAVVRGSARAYVTFLNKLRADVFDVLVNTMTAGPTPTQVELEAIANFINIATGRGNLGPVQSWAAGLNTAFFAPRHAISRFQLLFARPIVAGHKASPRVRNMVIKEYARTITATATVMALASILLQDDDDDDVIWDPRHSAFGKIKVGDTYIDFMAGLAQATRFTARNAAVIANLTEPLTGADFDEVKSAQGTAKVSANTYWRFMRTKFSPAISTPINVAARKNIVGDEIRLFSKEDTGPAWRDKDLGDWRDRGLEIADSSATLQLVTPLAVKEVVDTMMEQGVPKSIAISAMIMLGVGAQNYETEKSKPQFKF
jgi:hypothetical protein